LVLTSRDTVEGDLPNLDPIERNDSPPAIPREISSRSTDDNRSEHHSPPGFGRFQPDAINWVRTVDGDRPRRRLIDRCDSPASHRSHNSSRSETDIRSTTHLHRAKPRQRCCNDPSKPPRLWAAGYPSARFRKAAICPLVTLSSGEDRRRCMVCLARTITPPKRSDA